MPATETETEKKNDKWLHHVLELEDGKRFPSLPPDRATKLFDDILAAGEGAVAGLIDGLNEVDDGKDWKVRFVLGALASHVGAKETAAGRKKLEKAYTAALQDDRPEAVRTFVTMQLQWFGGPGCVAAVAEQLASDNTQLVDAAAATLTAIGKPAAGALKSMRGKAGEHAKTAIEHAIRQIGM